MTRSEDSKLIETASLVFNKMRDPANAQKSIKEIRDEVANEMGKEAVAELTEFLGISCGRVMMPAYVKPEQCSEKHPLTGKKCTGGKGHFGCHQVTWDPYHCEEWWVTPCSKASPIQECDYHENHGGNKRLSWEECIHCGDIKNLRVVGCAPAMELIMETDELMCRRAFEENAHDGGFIGDDGYGVLATDVLKSDIRISPSEAEDYDWPNWATHVVWHNR